MSQLQLQEFSRRRLENQNIKTLQTLCRREGISWRQFKTKGRKKEYVAALLNHRNAERDAGHDIAVPARDEVQRPPNVDHEAIVQQFIALNGVPAIYNIDANDEEPHNVNIQENGGDAEEGNMADDGANGPIANVMGNGGNGQIANIAGNGDGGNNPDDMKNIELDEDNNMVEEEWERLKDFLAANGLDLYCNGLFESGFDAMDVIATCEPADFIEIIRKKGHRIKLVNRAKKQLALGVDNNGNVDDGHNIFALEAMNGHNGHNNNGSVAISNALKLDYEGTLINRGLFCDAADTSSLRVAMDNAKAPMRFVPITNIRDPATGKRINTGQKAAKSIALLLAKWQLYKLDNFYHPEAARLEAPRRRGGNRWFKADISERRGPSEAYHLLADNKKDDFKEHFIKKYKKWINWKRLSLNKGDYDETMRLFGDIIN